MYILDGEGSSTSSMLVFLFGQTKNQLIKPNQMEKKLRLYTSMAMLWPILTIMCLYAAKQASAQQAEPAAPAVQDIQPLQIGDTIPDWLWQLPLTKWDAVSRGIKTVSLNEYRGKLIVLDFWNTYCGACIDAMPKMNALENQYKNSLAILLVSPETPE